MVLGALAMLKASSEWDRVQAWWATKHSGLIGEVEEFLREK